jgi:hypothetical protein
MRKQLVKKIGSYMGGAILLLSLTMAVMGESGYAPDVIATKAGMSGSGHSLGVFATVSWDIARDSKNNLYIMWFSKSSIYFGKIKNHAVTEQQTVTEKANNSKYCIPRLSIGSDGKTASIIYASPDQFSIMHAWLDNNNWYSETVYRASGDKVYFPAGAVDLQGTVHAAFTKTGAIRYLYKKPNKQWTNDIDIDNRNSEGTRMVVDSKGGVHCTWMPYMFYLNYRYAAQGHTLDKSTSERVLVDTIERVGIGDIFVTKNGIIHQTMADDRKVWHSFKSIGKPFSKPTCASIDRLDSSIEIFPAVGADEHGKVFVAWGEAKEDDGSNMVKLSTFENGQWTVQIMANNSNIISLNKPAMAVTDQAVYLLWSKANDELFLYSIPLVKVSSAINVIAQHLTESSFFNSHHFAHITWEVDPFNIENQVQIDHYNIYRKIKNAEKYDATPLAANIPASTLSFDDVSAAADTIELNFDYYVTTVALIDGNLVESAIIY